MVQKSSNFIKMNKKCKKHSKNIHINMFQWKCTLVNIFKRCITAWLYIQPRFRIYILKAHSLFYINLFLVYQNIVTGWRYSQLYMKLYSNSAKMTLPIFKSEFRSYFKGTSKFFFYHRIELVPENIFGRLPGG